MLEVLDGLLLIFIFVELLYAVRSCLRSREIVAEPFLIVGILACIKEIVVLSVEAATLLKDGPQFSRAIVEVAVLALWPCWCWRWRPTCCVSADGTTRDPAEEDARDEEEAASG